MPGEGAACVARGHIPQADGIVRTPTGEGGAIRTEDDALDNVRMPGEGLACGTGGGIPQADFFPTPTGEGGAIRTEDDPVGIPGEGA